MMKVEGPEGHLGGSMPENEAKEHILANSYKPAVRFTGVKLGELAEKATIHGGSEYRCWSLYKTRGGSYVIQLSESYEKRVEVCKKPEQVLTWMRRQNPDEPAGPKDWSPRIDFGVSEEQMKFLIGAEPKFKDLFFQDVE